MSYLSNSSYSSYSANSSRTSNSSYLTHRTARTIGLMAFIDAPYGLEYNPLAAQAREMRLPETQPHDQVQQLRYE